MGIRLRTGAVVALVVAVLLAVGFVVIAFTAPVVASESTTSDGTTTTTGVTLVQYGGLSVLGIVFAPLVTALVVSACLAFRGRYSVLGPLAWIAAGGLAVIGIAGLASVGLLILPVAIALLVAIALSRGDQVATA